MKRISCISGILILLGMIAATGCRVDPDRMNSVQDGDGNIYATRNIGTQKWLASNLRTTRYNDGTAISLVTKSDFWPFQNKPAYCWFNNDAGNALNYGALYNYYTTDSAVNGGKNICPVGWHVPTREEWEILIEYVGGINEAGSNLKVQGEGKWWVDFESKDPVMFSAWPAGYRTVSGEFETELMGAVWWTSTQNSAGGATVLTMQYDRDDVIITGNVSKRVGASLRCIEN